MQQSILIGVLLARHVSGDFAHHQERRPVLQHAVFCTQFFVLLCGYPGSLLRGPCVWCGWLPIINTYLVILLYLPDRLLTISYG
jgi:hypothetical protein